MKLNNNTTTGRLDRKEQLAELRQLEQDYRDKHNECFHIPDRHNSESDDDFDPSDSTNSTDLSELRELGDRYATLRSQLGLPPKEL